MRTGDLARYGTESIRPDLPIPLPPVVGLPAFFRRTVIGLKTPSFRRARRVTLFWAVAGLGLLILSRTPPLVGLSPVVTVIILVIALYVTIRTLAVPAFERRQRLFEADWLRAQSEMLRAYAFDVVRFTVPVDQEGAAPVGRRRVLNLTDPADVGRLVRQQLADPGAGGRVRAEIEFTYWPGGGEEPVVGHVRRPLKDIVLHSVDRPTRARVRFPDARYGIRAVPGRYGGGEPAPTTYWFLSGPVRLTATAPG